MRAQLLILTLLLLPSPGAAAAPAPAVQIALLPVETINLSSGEGARYQDLLAELIRAHPEASLQAGPATAPAGCAAEIACLREMGERLGVQKLLSLRVGRLGETTLVRLVVFDVPRSARQGTWQEVLRSGDPATVRASLERILVGLLPRRPAPPAWYTRWWIWTAAAVVVGGSVTAVVLATRPDSRPPDIRIVPP